jgi:hypothetical protein
MNKHVASIEPLEARIAPAFAAVFELSGLDGLNGFTINGVTADDVSGRSVNDAGDVNGDGFDDLIIGAAGADPNGASYVVFGKEAAFSSDLDLSALNGSNGFKLSGVAANDSSGNSVSAAGDVNGDGFDDLVIGAINAAASGSASGATYVVFGKASGFAPNLNLSALNGATGFMLSGAAALDVSGRSVSAAGDINGDGFDDVIIGADGADPNELGSGASYVIFGKASAFAASLNLSALNGVNGFKLSGVAAYDASGWSVSAAGDVNGDGFDDLIIGALGADPNGFSSGVSYVIFGKASGFEANLNLSTLNGSNGFKLSGVADSDYSGNSVSAAGDVNGDGFDDLIIGAYGAAPNGRRSGASYLVFGKADGFAADLNLSTLNGGNGFELSGGAPVDNSGTSVGAAGDVNGDGFDDLIIGAPGADPNGDESGATYIVLGKKSGFAATINLSALNGADGFKINGVADGDRSGFSVTGAGDLNGDGFDDMLIGAYRADPNGSESGASYVVFGRGIEINVGDAVADEGDSGATALQFTVSLSEAGTAPITVQVRTIDGTAHAGSDYTPLDQPQLTFAPGETSKTVTVKVIGDTLYESDETLSIVLGVSSGGAIRDGVGAGTVRNTDAPPLVNIASGAALEGDSGTNSLTFTASLSAASGLPASVEFLTVDGTALAGSDYIAQAAALILAPGEISKTITVEVVGDTRIEGHELFSVILVGASGATIGNRTAVGTILNDDTTISIRDAASIVEGDAGTTAVVFSVGLEAPSAVPVTVNFASANGTASAESDYTALAPGTLTFSPGETSKTISVDVFGETTFEGDETFSVVLSGATNAATADGTATGTIRNDDVPPVVTVSDGSIVEGDSGASSVIFQLSLSAPSGLPVSIQYATADGSALAGSDFTTPINGAEITFVPGETSKTIAIEVSGDTTIETHEVFALLLSNPTSATLSATRATGTILNDDTAIRIGDATVLEGHSDSRSLVFDVTLSAPSALPATVNFARGEGTATNGTDYAALIPGTLTFAPGERSKTVTIEVSGDTIAEPSETFSVLLSDASNAVIEDGSGLGTILDDDVTLASKRKATFIDVDGDLVTIAVSKGTLKVENFTLFPSGLGSQLALIDFSGAQEFSGATLTITAKRPSGTTGGAVLVHVGAIDAAGIDLGKVVVSGDLGQIDAGTDLTPERGLMSLNAHSLGGSGLSTQLPGGSLQSDVVGALKTLALADGMYDAALVASGDIGSVMIKGDLRGSAIRSDGRIGAVKISGDLSGTISARGALAPASVEKALAIGSVSIGGSVEHAQILAGYDRGGVAMNADAAIGRVLVGRNWLASDVVAGASAGADGLFGTDDDVLISIDNPFIARIASIVIKGTATGTAGESDHFGFVAEEIGAFESGNTNLTLQRGRSNDTAGLPVGITADLFVREVA